jgi:hypothetical protein
MSALDCPAHVSTFKNSSVAVTHVHRVPHGVVNVDLAVVECRPTLLRKHIAYHFERFGSGVIFEYST